MPYRISTNTTFLGRQKIQNSTDKSGCNQCRLPVSSAAVAVQFQVYTHEDLKCSVKVVGRDDVQEFRNFAEAMRAVLRLNGSEKSHLTVYSVMGTVIFEALV